MNQNIVPWFQIQNTKYHPTSPPHRHSTAAHRSNLGELSGGINNVSAEQMLQILSADLFEAFFLCVFSSFSKTLHHNHKLLEAQARHTLGSFFISDSLTVNGGPSHACCCSQLRLLSLVVCLTECCSTCHVSWSRGSFTVFILSAV